MKSVIMFGFSGAVLLLLASGCATSRSGGTASPSAEKGRPDTQYVELTGSYLKQPINRNGLITDGPSQVVVIDREAIERTGASDVRQVLNRYGYSWRR